MTTLGKENGFHGNKVTNWEGHSRVKDYLSGGFHFKDDGAESHWGAAWIMDTQLANYLTIDKPELSKLYCTYKLI